MSLMEFYSNAANKSVPCVAANVRFPATEQWAEKKIAAFGGALTIIEEGYGEAIIPVTRLDLIRTFLPAYEITPR